MMIYRHLMSPNHGWIPSHDSGRTSLTLFVFSRLTVSTSNFWSSGLSARKSKGKESSYGRLGTVSTGKQGYKEAYPSSSSSSPFSPSSGPKSSESSSQLMSSLVSLIL